MKVPIGMNACAPVDPRAAWFGAPQARRDVATKSQRG